MKTRLPGGALLALTLLSSVSAADRLDVVYHVSEAEKVAFVLNNMQNHIDGLGGADKINLVMVAHGPAIEALTEMEATDRVKAGQSALREQGVAFEMCGNTLKGFKLTLDELLPGFVEVSQGGVTRIGELQSRGYVYIRP